MSLTLGEVKAHLVVTHSDDDVLIQGLIDAATVHAERYLRVSFADDYSDVIPKPVETAIMKHVYQMNEERGGNGSANVLPAGYKDLMSTYRNLG